MANQPSPDNVQRSLRVQRDLDAKIQKKFRVDESMNIKDCYIIALIFATRGVDLSVEDYERIAIEKKEAINKTKKMER